MELSLNAFAVWFSTLTLQLIDRALDQRFIGKVRLDKLPDLIGKLNEGLAEPTEFSSVCLALHAHLIISIQIMRQNARKKLPFSKKIGGFLKKRC
jgi:hypothetical protein